MGGKDLHIDDDRLRQSAESVLLVLLSRWSSVLLVPIILGVGGWIVSTVNTLNITVSSLQNQLASQSKLFDEKLNMTGQTLSLRITAAEQRIGRLEYQQDADARKLRPQK